MHKIGARVNGKTGKNETKLQLANQPITNLWDIDYCLLICECHWPLGGGVHLGQYTVIGIAALGPQDSLLAILIKQLSLGRGFSVPLDTHVANGDPDHELVDDFIALH